MTMPQIAAKRALSTDRSGLVQRYQELVERKFTVGLTPQEGETLQQLQQALSVTEGSEAVDTMRASFKKDVLKLRDIAEDKGPANPRRDK
ncbi:MAG: hypothetical protein HY820_11550 [Acidobacteria bacterium]|nr:hypothetical protein [Acidobacteriota bacterium]